jgi:DUF971 family protein
MSAHPVQIHLRQAERTLEIVWSDDATTIYALEYLRGWCPCAHCQGHFAKEMRFHEVPGVTLENVDPVGSYALKLRWSGGHDTGIYAFDYLRKIFDEAPGEGPSNQSFLGD